MAHPNYQNSFSTKQLNEQCAKKIALRSLESYWPTKAGDNLKTRVKSYDHVSIDGFYYKKKLTKSDMWDERSHGIYRRRRCSTY